MKASRRRHPHTCTYPTVDHLSSLYINIASASKVGQFRPFWGEVKKTKRSADEYFSFQILECGSTTLETTLDAFCERSFNLLDATNAAI